MEDWQEVLSEPQFNRLRLFIYLIPVFGMAPATWTLLQRTSNRHYRAASRLSVTLGFVWLVGYLMMHGAHPLAIEGDSPSQVSQLLFNSLWTSGYFLTTLWLMTRLWKRQSLEVHGISQIAKHLP
jgi:hypothetical protein